MIRIYVRSASLASSHYLRVRASFGALTSDTPATAPGYHQQLFAGQRLDQRETCAFVGSQYSSSGAEPQCFHPRRMRSIIGKVDGIAAIIAAIELTSRELVDERQRLRIGGRHLVDNHSRRGEGGLGVSEERKGLVGWLSKRLMPSALDLGKERGMDLQNRLDYGPSSILESIKLPQSQKQ